MGGKAKEKSNSSGSSSALEVDDNSMALSDLGPLLQCLHRDPRGSPLGQRHQWSSRGRASAAIATAREARSASGGGGRGECGGEGIGVGAPEFSGLVSL